MTKEKERKLEPLDIESVKFVNVEEDIPESIYLIMNTKEGE